MFQGLRVLLAAVYTLLSVAVSVDAFVPSTSSIMGLKMTSPNEQYLNSLRPQSTQAVLQKGQLIKAANSCTKVETEIDTILFNIFKVENVFFSRHSRTIMFKLKQDMTDLYLYENDVMQRLTNGTKIYAKSFKNFMFVPMEFEDPVDAIMYKDEQI
jgi:hypothetical protein